MPEDVAEYILSDEPENESDSEEKPKKSKLEKNGNRTIEGVVNC